MSGVEWSMWANEHALTSSYILMIGSILGSFPMFNYWQAAITSIPISIIIWILEYPRGVRISGNTPQRRYQYICAAIVSKLGFVTRNYYVRFIILLILSVPGWFLLPTLLGSVNLAIAAGMYFKAAWMNEEWKPPEPQTSNNPWKSHTPVNPPTRPPPRHRDIGGTQGGAQGGTQADSQL